MKSQDIARGKVRERPPTRAERRAAERIERRHAKRNRHGGVPVSSLIGGALTVLVVVAALIYAFTRAGTGDVRDALANPQALNPSPSLLSAGQKAPDFSLRDANGMRHTLSAQRGHPVLLEYFAVWCPVCQAEAPVMARITRNYVPKGVRVWSILANPYGKNYDLSGRKDLTLATHRDLSWFARHFDVHHPQLIDPEFGTVNRYGVSAYPGIYVVDSKGVITFAHEGHQTYRDIAGLLDKALSKPS